MEIVLVVGLLASTTYTVFVSPGVPLTRPWIQPAAVGAIVVGLLGLVVRARGIGRLAGAAYCLAALAPNGLYVLNILVFAAGVAALAGVGVGEKRRNGDRLGTEHNSHA